TQAAIAAKCAGYQDNHILRGIGSATLGTQRAAPNSMPSTTAVVNTVMLFAINELFSRAALTNTKSTPNAASGVAICSPVFGCQACMAKNNTDTNNKPKCPYSTV